MCAQPVEPAGWPTRSPYRIEPDEGPRTIAELKAALAAWPQDLIAFTARLDTCPFEQIGDLVAEYRMVWLARTHPTLRKAEHTETEGPDPDGVPAEAVWADYDDNLELRPDAAVRAELGEDAR